MKRMVLVFLAALSTGQFVACGGDDKTQWSCQCFTSCNGQSGTTSETVCGGTQQSAAASSTTSCQAQLQAMSCANPTCACEECTMNGTCSSTPQ